MHITFVKTQELVMGQDNFDKYFLPKDLNEWDINKVQTLIEIVKEDRNIDVTKSKSDNPPWWSGFVFEFVINRIRVSAQIRSAGTQAYSICVSDNSITKNIPFNIYNKEFKEIYNYLDIKNML